MGLWYLAEPLRSPAALQAYSQTELVSALASVCAALIAFLAGYEGWRRFCPSVSSLDLSALNNRTFLWHAFLVTTFLGFVPLLIISKGNVWTILEDAFFSRKRWTSLFQRGRYGDARDALLELQMFLRAATPLAAAILFGRGHRWFKRVAAASLLSYLLARGMHDGSRLKFLEVVVPASAAVFWCAPANQRKRVLLLTLPLFTAASIIWAAAAVQGRNAGNFRWRDAFSVRYVGFEMFRELLFLRRTVPETSPWQRGYTYYVQAINPIPRFLWPSKPIEDAGLQLAVLQNAVVNGEPKLTVAPGLIGEMYWNFGTIGIVGLSFLLGAVVAWWDLLLWKPDCPLPQFIVFSMGLVVVFATGRSINISNLYGLLALFGTMFLMSRLTPVRSDFVS